MQALCFERRQNAGTAPLIRQARRLRSRRRAARDIEMKRVVKKKVDSPPSPLQGLFHAFARLAERAGEGRPQLRGLRVARDPSADRFVVVHLGARVEFLLVIQADGEPPKAAVECRRVDGAGVTETTLLARFCFNEAGVVTESTVPELVDERVDQSPAAWSIVAAVMWCALETQA
jgi:hypothetical protein